MTTPYPSLRDLRPVVTAAAAVTLVLAGCSAGTDDGSAVPEADSPAETAPTTAPAEGAATTDSSDAPAESTGEPDTSGFNVTYSVGTVTGSFYGSKVTSCVVDSEGETRIEASDGTDSLTLVATSSEDASLALVSDGSTFESGDTDVPFHAAIGEDTMTGRGQVVGPDGTTDVSVNALCLRLAED